MGRTLLFWLFCDSNLLGLLNYFSSWFRLNFLEAIWGFAIPEEGSEVLWNDKGTCKEPKLNHSPGPTMSQNWTKIYTHNSLTNPRKQGSSLSYMVSSGKEVPLDALSPPSYMHYESSIPYSIDHNSMIKVLPGCLSNLRSVGWPRHRKHFGNPRLVWI
jgi:hypothetical protein